jgi:pilus assembly protein Flp/PilA
MSKLTSAVRRFLRNDDGATMAEYALLVAVIAIVAVAGAKLLGGSVNTQLTNAATKVATP